MGNGIRVENGQPLQRPQIDPRSVKPGGLLRPMRTGDELGAGAQPHVGSEDAVRIVQIGQDQIELRKVVRHVFRQPAAAGEKAGQRAGVNGLYAVHEAARQRELGDVGIAQHFEMRLGELPAQGCDGRQGQDKVPNRPAPNDQNLALERTHRISALTPSLTTNSRPLPQVLHVRRAQVTDRNTVSPSAATNKPNARRTPHPTLMRCSVAVPQASKSRSRQGEIVNQMPATTRT